MSKKDERNERKVRKALYAGVKVVSRHVWEEAMRITQSSQAKQREQGA
jgi:hypothetical protein